MTMVSSSVDRDIPSPDCFHGVLSEGASSSKSRQILNIKRKALMAFYDVKSFSYDVIFTRNHHKKCYRR